MTTASVKFMLFELNFLTNYFVTPDVQRYLFLHSTVDIISNPVLSWLSFRIVIQLLLVKNHSFITLNFPGENLDKGSPEDADLKASEGVLYPLETFFAIFRDSFPTSLKYQQRRRDDEKNILF